VFFTNPQAIGKRLFGGSARGKTPPARRYSRQTPISQKVGFLEQYDQELKEAGDDPLSDLPGVRKELVDDLGQFIGCEQLLEEGDERDGWNANQFLNTKLRMLMSVRCAEISESWIVVSRVPVL
jgi:hypothetical protein